MQICWSSTAQLCSTMYYVQIRTYLAVSSYVRTIYVFHYQYIRTNTGIYVLYVYTYKYVPQKYIEKYVQKYVHEITYNNTKNYVHLYLRLRIRNFNKGKYVQDSLLMEGRRSEERGAAGSS